MAETADTKPLVGKWLYRSLRTNKVLETAFNDLEFGRGIIEFKRIAYDQILDSYLDMGDNYVLKIQGEVFRRNGKITQLKWRGTGVPGSPTESWIYDYQAYIAPTWDESTDKTIRLIGSVLRTIAHGSAPAGVTGTFYMIKLD